MGQTAPTDQAGLRNIDQCGEESDLGCPEHLSVGCDCQEEAQSPLSALHFFTNSGGQFVREKAHFIVGCGRSQTNIGASRR